MWDNYPRRNPSLEWADTPRRIPGAGFVEGTVASEWLWRCRPSGASKWNPIEHRVFCQISKNWASQPLKSFQTALNYIRTTTTSTGLKVCARLLRKKYEKGEKISAQKIKQLGLTRPKTLPMWNYTLRPI